MWPRLSYRETSRNASKRVRRFRSTSMIVTSSWTPPSSKMPCHGAAEISRKDGHGMATGDLFRILLVGGLVAIWLIFPLILGMSSSQLTVIFFRGVAQPPTSFKWTLKEGVKQNHTYFWGWSCESYRWTVENKPTWSICAPNLGHQFVDHFSETFWSIGPEKSREN